MAKPDQQTLASVIQPHLEPGERLKNCAIAYRKPHFLLIIASGVIATALLTKYFVVALTDRRLLILRYKGKLQVQEVMEYRLDQIPPIKTSTGLVHTNLTLSDPRQKFFCQFHRNLAVQNREQALAIVEALQNAGFQSTPSIPPVQQWTAPPPAPRTAPPPLPAEAASFNGVALRLGARRFSLQPDATLREDDIAGLLSHTNDGIVAKVDRNPNNPAILGLKNLSTSAWAITLPDGETRELASGRSVKLARGTQIGFGFCNGEIEM